MSCQVCKDVPHKYKCPKCFVKYCSLDCYKTHKVLACQVEDKSEPQEPDRTPGSQEQAQFGQDNDDENNTADRVSDEALTKLGVSEELCEMLHNSHLRRIIKQLDGSSTPQTDVEAAMHEPIFMEFADQCLALVEPNKDQVET